MDSQDDTHEGYFRPYTPNAARGARRVGKHAAWEHRSPSSRSRRARLRADDVKTDVHTSVEAPQLRTRFPHARRLHTVKARSVLWWRSVGRPHGVLDRDVIDSSRQRRAGPGAFPPRDAREAPASGVLNLAAEKSGWGRRSRKGEEKERRGGARIVQRFGAQVAEVTVAKDAASKSTASCRRRLRVAVNPTYRAQWKADRLRAVSGAPRRDHARDGPWSIDFTTTAASNHAVRASR